MDVTERRKSIMRILYRNRHTTIASLAMHLGVSERTVRRDIEALSLYEPIYTTAGRYGGGVHMMDGAEEGTARLRQNQIEVIQGIIDRTENNSCYISDADIDILKEFLRENAGYARHASAE